MQIRVIRHAFSEANRSAGPGEEPNLAFGRPEAELNKVGLRQAKDLGAALANELGVDLITTPVAVSGFKRSQQTAEVAGFQLISPSYAVLNEVEHGLEGTVLKAMLERDEVPEAAYEAAKRLLRQPPPEPVWITHGLIIMALCDELGLPRSRWKRFKPKFCEVRTLPIG